MIDIKELDELFLQYQEAYKKTGDKFQHLTTKSIDLLQVYLNLKLSKSIEALNAEIRESSKAQEIYSSKMFRAARALNRYTLGLGIFTLMIAVATILVHWHLQNKSFKHAESVQQNAYQNDLKIQELNYRNELALKGA